MLPLLSYYITDYVSTHNVPLFCMQVLRNLRDNINSEDRSQPITFMISGCHVGGRGFMSKRTCSWMTINRQIPPPSPHQGWLYLQHREGEELAHPTGSLSSGKGRSEVSRSPWYTREQAMQQQWDPCHRGLQITLSTSAPISELTHCQK